MRHIHKALMHMEYYGEVVHEKTNLAMTTTNLWRRKRWKKRI